MLLLDNYFYRNYIESNNFFLAGIIESRDRNEMREKVLAHLISMTVQLKYLLIEQFIWILHVVQYVSFLLFVLLFQFLEYIFVI